MMIGEVYIGLGPANITPITHVTMLDCCVYMLRLIMLMYLFMATKDAILVVIMEEVDLSLNRPDTITFKIV